jgi:glutathione reductase (NADPH)
MERRFDLVVIGTGTAGTGVATTCRAAGWSVAIVDELPFGGTCVLRGCDPKKVLVGAAEAMDWIRRMQGKGIAGGATISWPALMAFKRTFTEPVPAQREKSFAEHGIVGFHGAARFTGPRSVQVGAETLTARHVVIATGAKPAALGIPGAEHVVTSDVFLELEELPKSIVFLGGGYISFEFAHVAARAGSKVTILHRGARPLVAFDEDLVRCLVKAGAERGVDLELDIAVESIEKRGGKFAVRAKGGRCFEADLVVHGAGRVPHTEALDLERASVTRTKRGGVVVNEFLQSTSNPAIYGAGDVASAETPALTPVASRHARTVAHNLLHGNERTPNLTEVPSVVFTIPPLAMVGLTETAARDKGVKFTARLENASSWYSTRRTGESHAASKVLLEEGTRRIVGAHLLGPHAPEVINVFALAMRANLTADDVKETTFAYPTGASDLSYLM